MNYIPVAKLIGAVVLVLSLLGGGYWFNGVLNDRKALEKQVAELEANTASLRAERDKANTALTEAVKRAQQARVQAQEALEKLKHADSKDAQAWKRGSIPADIADSLRDSPANP